MANRSIHLIDQLEREKILEKEEFIQLFHDFSEEILEYSREKARTISKKYFGNQVYTRGLIEFSNVCRNDCYYCGIRKSNRELKRYSLSEEEIIECCKRGYKLGFRTFVLQSGENMKYTTPLIVKILTKIKDMYPDCAITLSIGERNYESYEAFKKAGANRFLLRHETANEEHYGRLHPRNLSLEERKKCLFHLKELEYQVGTGFMVGSPYQTVECLAEDLLFIRELSPHMVGIGPFLPHNQTPFKEEKMGSYKLTLFLLSILRIMIPNVLLPATTALGTIHPSGREEGILSGANVVMPNLSPLRVRTQYELYDNKICTGEEVAECQGCLEKRMKSIGYEISYVRGDFKEL